MNESSERMDLLRARYAGSLGEKQRALGQAWGAFAAMPSDAATRVALQQQQGGRIETRACRALDVPLPQGAPRQRGVTMSDEDVRAAIAFAATSVEQDLPVSESPIR